MSKNKFGMPGILFESTPLPSPTGVVGGGSAQGGQGNNDLPMSYDDWSQNPDIFGFYDVNSDNAGDWDEYGRWWADCDYSYDQWVALGYDQQKWDTYVKPHLW